MAQLKPGDRISVAIKSGIIVSSYSEDYDEIIVFEILKTDEQGYYLFIPGYINIKNTITIDKGMCKALQLDNKYLYEETIHIAESLIFKIVDRVSDGCACQECLEFFNMAEPNQENEGFVCWRCRNYKVYF